MNPIDHERFSERLSPYIRGDLGPEETEEIRAHVAECAMCRQEEVALTALLATPLEGLRPEESERLRAAVMAEITAQEGPSLVAVAPSKAAFVEPRRSWAPRIAQFMAAAAVLALAAIYLTNPQVSPLGGGDDAEVPAAIQDSEAEGNQGGREDGRRERDDPGATTNDPDVVAEQGAEFAGTEDGGAGGGSGTRSGGDEAGDTIAAASGDAPPTEGTGDQVAALKANASGFGVEAALHRQQR